VLVTSHLLKVNATLLMLCYLYVCYIKFLLLLISQVDVWLMDRCPNQSQDNAGTEPFHRGAGGGCAAGGAEFQLAVL